MGWGRKICEWENFSGIKDKRNKLFHLWYRTVPHTGDAASRIECEGLLGAARKIGGYECIRVIWPRPIGMQPLGVGGVDEREFLETWEVERGKFYDQVRSILKSKNQEISRLQLAVKLPWAIFFESVDILS
ncbi:hypothetical protein TNCV_4411971 [Trichonephila clavipes]|nr:hypothetical protein TNCV_4411971 [Trichonephila clavipes]